MLVFVAVTVEAGSDIPFSLYVSVVVVEGDVEDLTFFVGVEVGESEPLRAFSAVELFVTSSSGPSSSTSGAGVRLRGKTSGGLCAGVRW